MNVLARIKDQGPATEQLLRLSLHQPVVDMGDTVMYVAELDWYDTLNGVGTG